MIPELCNSISDAACVAEVNDMLADEPIVEREVNPYAPARIMSSFLYRLPYQARHYEKYLKDLKESRNKRFRRMENENVDAFLKRFAL